MKKLGRNDLCWCGSGKKYKHCHEAFDEKLMEAADAGYQIPDHDMIKTPEQIEGIRESCKINVAVLDYVAEHIKAGVTTEEIDQWVYNETTRMGGIPAPLGYEGFPKSVCTSINDQVCHGIPSEDVVLKDGDIINVDVSTIYHGYYADSSRMFCIGNVSPEHKKLVNVVKECVELGLEQVKPWGFMGDMAEAVQKHAEENGYSVVREIGGHGGGGGLLDGVKQLRDGAMQLSDGLKQFNEEGVEKLVSVLGDDVEGLAERLTATVEVSRNYRSFSGLTDGMDGAVRFIYRTEAVEKAE